jgi:hypothetical protein
VNALRTDPVKRAEFAEALWGPIATQYQVDKLRLGFDLLLQGSLGVVFGAIAGGAEAAEGGTVTLYHGTTRSAASRILQTGFRLGKDGAVFFAEDFATAEQFASEMAARRLASATVLRLRVSSSIALQLQRGVIGEFRGLSFVDVPGGTGFERILLRESLGEFNAAMKSGAISVDGALSHLTRQACFSRKEEVFDQVLRHVASDSLIVRSAAVHMAIWTTFILERFPQRAMREENRPGAKPSLRERVQQIVRRALDRGLNAEVTELARRFLSNLPPDPGS